MKKYLKFCNRSAENQRNRHLFYYITHRHLMCQVVPHNGTAFIHCSMCLHNVLHSMKHLTCSVPPWLFQRHITWVHVPFRSSPCRPAPEWSRRGRKRGAVSPLLYMTADRRSEGDRVGKDSHD